MRPVRLELSGFTSFRQHTVVDFGDADYFCLAGPTGSGKSSLIDAICFALYGSVPRYDDKRLIAAVITQGQLEARVRLDFNVDGRAYTAVRVVRKSAQGASTKEARLECEGEVLAGTAKELTDEVIKLLGLGFEHFTKCVVLPQGEFARFLHDDPSTRQDMLVRLLNLGLYGEMRKAARSRAVSAKAKIEFAQQRLDEEFASATQEVLGTAESRVASLEKLMKNARRSQPTIDKLAHDIAEAGRAADEQRRWTKLIEDLSIPGEIASLAKARRECDGLIGVSNAEVKAAREKVEKVEKELATLPERDPIAHAHATYGRLEVDGKQLKQKAKELAELAGAEEKAAAAAVEARADRETAERALESLRDANRAQHLAEALAPGEKCPVCLQKVTQLPTHPHLEDLDHAEAAALKARTVVDEIAEALEAARDRRSGAAGSVQEMEAGIARLEDEVKDYPGREKIQGLLKEIDAARAALDDARAAIRRAEEKLDSARTRHEELKATEDGLRRGFEERRDTLVPLGPPPPERHNLGDDWGALMSWATAKLPELSGLLEKTQAQMTALQSRRDEMVVALQDACAECDVIVEDEDLVGSVIAAHAHALQKRDEVKRAIADVATLNAQVADFKKLYEVAHQLELHLSGRAGYFESWLVGEAMIRLIEGATAILLELSNDQYGLILDEATKAFSVIDHHGADEVRSAKTLSGGETFLTSLALALALSDQLVELAAEGSARLDAIFLDEGFGTLDPETLDTVAATVENLAAGGRMVGVITHVRELADRIPLQFRVRKDLRSSYVERVET